MKRSMVVILSLIFFIIPVVVTIHAQTNMEQDYNWCGDLDVWGNGECVNQDPFVQDCMWQMGWYLPRVAAGEFSLSDIKSDCLYIAIANEAVQVESVTDPETGCTYLIVKLNGSSYSGKYDVLETTDNYDGNAQDLGDCLGLEIHGNDNANSITGSLGNDRIFGYGGNDIIVGDSYSGTGSSGDDYIDGGDGDDFISGDSLLGYGAGNDTIYGGDGVDTIYGDSVTSDGSSGDDYIDGGNGDDTIYGDSNDYSGDDGDDTIYGGAGNDTIYGDHYTDGGDGNDSIYGDDGDDTIYGDSYSGTDSSGDDYINGGDGDDTIYGDTYFGGGTGDDTIDAGAGNDTIYGDTTFGSGSGDDTIDGGADNDSVNGPGKDGDTVTNVETNNSTADN